jgi:uncharacterized protein YabN with tetrapyrrole methylase and pyrophosphatase domain
MIVRDQSILSDQSREPERRRNRGRSVDAEHRGADSHDPRQASGGSDIYLLGSGIYSSLQLTRETEQAIRSCRTVFVLHDDLMVHDALRELCVDVRDLAPLYDGERRRRDVYRKIADLLIGEALARPRVALVTYGHPLFLVSASELILKQAQSNGLKATVLPAVSSFDTLLCDLGVGYGHGVQIFDATSMLVNRWIPNPRVPLLLFQIATILNEGVERGQPSSRHLLPLVEYLQDLYPFDHECHVVHSASFILESPRKRRVRLRSLARSRGLDLWRRPSLYIPAIECTKVFSNALSPPNGTPNAAPDALESVF